MESSAIERPATSPRSAASAIGEPRLQPRAYLTAPDAVGLGTGGTGRKRCRPTEPEKPVSDPQESRG